MHTLFSEWYKTADPSATRETIAHRWAATAELAEGLKPESAIQLATYLYERTAGPPDWFRTAHKAHDEQMLTRGIDEEFRILAAITMRLAVEATDDPPLSTVASLALLTGAFALHDEPHWLREHLHTAAQNLATLGQNIRHPKRWATLPEPITAASINTALTSAYTMIQTVAESNDLLWWALAKYSLRLSTPYSDLSPPVLALVAPCDAFPLAKYLPFAPETEMIVLHVLLSTPGFGQANLSLKNYFTGLGRERAQALTPPPVPPTCTLLAPLSWALNAVAAGQRWQAEFEKDFGARLATKIPAQSISLQLLRELALAKIMSEAA